MGTEKGGRRPEEELAGGCGVEGDDGAEIEMEVGSSSFFKRR